MITSALIILISLHTVESRDLKFKSLWIRKLNFLVWLVWAYIVVQIRAITHLFSSNHHRFSSNHPGTILVGSRREDFCLEYARKSPLVWTREYQATYSDAPVEPCLDKENDCLPLCDGAFIDVSDKDPCLVQPTVRHSSLCMDIHSQCVVH